MHIFPENLTTFEQNLEVVFANLIQMLTSEARFLNLKTVRSRGADHNQLFFTRMIIFSKNYFQNNSIFFQFKSGQIYMKDAECAETNEKSIFRILRFFSFWDMVIFVPKIGNFRWIFSTKSTMTWKIKIWNMIFHSIRHCGHLM